MSNFFSCLNHLPLPTPCQLCQPLPTMDYDLELHDFSSFFSLKGKIAVITGGSRGLGLSAASA